MRRFSKLQKELYLVIDPTINFQIHCSVYRMQSEKGSTDLPRYWITLNGETIFDYPKQFINSNGELKNYSPKAICQGYPYRTDISAISGLIREYLDTPVDELLTKYFQSDYWGLANILRSADRRIGKRRLDILRRRKSNPAAQKIIAARQGKH